MTESEARAAEEGDPVRATAVDGLEPAVTADFDPDRLDLAVFDGTAVAATSTGGIDLPPTEGTGTMPPDGGDARVTNALHRVSPPPPEEGADMRDLRDLLVGVDIGGSARATHRVDLTSSTLSDDSRLPERCTHDHGNVSPALSWRGVPGNAEDLILVCHDPGAAGGPFVHWLVWGIAPSTTGVAEDTDPVSSTSRPNSFGETGWTGPQPPPGDGAHHYVFTLVALATPLDLTDHSSAADLLLAVDRAEVARGRLVATYER